MKYEIEDDKPLTGDEPKYPFADLEVKQSFVISETYDAKEAQKFRSNADYHAKNFDPVRKFTVRKDGSKTRVWRIK